MAKPKTKKSRRPANTAFKQQRLRAWQPLLTPRSVIPMFFAFAMIFGPIGGILYYFSSRVFEMTFNYTNCKSTSIDYSPFKLEDYQIKVKGASPQASSVPQMKYNPETNLCTIQFQLPTALKPPILMYYKLNNFYQNNRMYAKSYNTDQLKGEALTISQLAGGDCEPLASRTINNQTKPIYPCGLIANSLFNDTFSSPILTNPKGQDSSAEYKMSSTGITWSYDKDRYGKTSYKNTDVFPPPFWDARYPNGYNSTNSIPDLSQDENFMVWMRPAAFPSFLKLYSRNDVDTMETGVYQINIEMNFDTIPIKAEKFLVLSSSNFLGGRNPNLGITYFAFSGICILLGILFIVRHLYRPRRLGDHSYLSWNQQIQSGLVNNIVS